MKQTVPVKDVVTHLEAIRKEVDQLLAKLQTLVNRLHHAEDAQLEAVFGTVAHEAEEPAAV